MVINHPVFRKGQPLAKFLPDLSAALVTELRAGLQLLLAVGALGWHLRRAALAAEFGSRLQRRAALHAFLR